MTIVLQAVLPRYDGEPGHDVEIRCNGEYLFVRVGLEGGQLQTRVYDINRLRPEPEIVNAATNLVVDLWRGGRLPAIPVPS